MAAETAIEWCDATFNPWIGCTKIAPACDHCYAERDTHRFGRVQWGAGQPRVRTSESNWKKVETWNARHADFDAAHGRRRRVFCASLADVFDNEIDPQWRADLFALIARTPNLDWLLLTKRIGNAAKMMSDAGGFLEPSPGCQTARKNVWIGATVTSQAEADRDVPKLLQVPAVVRFLSMEPLLGPVDLSEWLYHFKACDRCPCPDPEASRDGWEECCRDPELEDSGIHWIIAGGESGPNARPMHPEWVRQLRVQCADRAAFLFKQWGEWAPADRATCETPRCGFIHPTLPEIPRPPERRPLGIGYGPYELQAMGCAFVAKVGRTAAGRLLDGIEHNGFPEAARA